MATIQCAQQPDGTTNFYINIAVGDPLDWAASIWSNQTWSDPCIGSWDPVNYPCHVENIFGTNTQTINKNYTSHPGNYMIAFSVSGAPSPTFCYFTVSAVTCTFSMLDIPNISVAVGNTYTHAASCKDSCGNWINCPSSGFSWSSSNPAVASITNSSNYAAIVTGISAGTATITVSNQGITTTGTVTVTGGGGTPGYKCITPGQPCQQNCTVGQVGCFTTQAECNGTCTTGGTGYSCTTSGCQQGCTLGTSGCYADPTSCSVACSGGGGGASCVPACTKDQTCLSAVGLGCQPTIYIYGAVAGFFMLMLLKK